MPALSSSTTTVSVYPEISRTGRAGRIRRTKLAIWRPLAPGMTMSGPRAGMSPPPPRAAAPLALHGAERRFAARDLHHPIAGLAQQAGDQAPNRAVVLDEEDRLRPTWHLETALGRGRRRLVFHTRQIDVERSADPDLTVHDDVPADLRDDPVAGGEPEACALSHFLRGEERLEEVGLHLLAHAAAIVME